MEIDGIIYYNRLIQDDNTAGRTLFGDYKNRMDMIRSGIIVCRNVPKYHKYVGLGCNPDTGKTERKFALFKSHVDLYNHIIKVPVEKRSFFEIIQGNKPHKPHFDIDFDMSKGLTTEYVAHTMSNIIDAVIDTIKENGVVLNLAKDILIYTSSRPEKASYHIIINGWMHNDNKDAKNLAKQIRCRFPSEIADYIDKSVYSTKQQFRLLHCTKLRTKNTKVPIMRWNTSKYTITYPYIPNAYDEFLASLVGVTIGCNHIPPFFDPDAGISVSSDGIVTQVESTGSATIEYKLDLKKKDIDKCITELYKTTESIIGCTKNSASVWNVFSVRSIEGGFISLTKRRPYYCPICARQHENENPYMTVNGKGVVKYHCRRSETSMEITTLDDVTSEQIQDVTSEQIQDVEEEDFVGITPKLLNSMELFKLNSAKDTIKEEHVEKRPSGFKIITNYNRWKR